MIPYILNQPCHWKKFPCAVVSIYKTTLVCDSHDKNFENMRCMFLFPNKVCSPLEHSLVISFPELGELSSHFGRERSIKEQLVASLGARSEGKWVSILSLLLPLFDICLPSVCVPPPLTHQQLTGHQAFLSSLKGQCSIGGDLQQVIPYQAVVSHKPNIWKNNKKCLEHFRNHFRCTYMNVPFFLTLPLSPFTCWRENVKEWNYKHDFLLTQT